MAAERLDLLEQLEAARAEAERWHRRNVVLESRMAVIRAVVDGKAPW